MSIAGLWDALVDAICRPPRDTYSTSELPGGKRKRFKVKEEVVERQDLTLINKAGQRLECSHYKPESTKSLESLPIVIYCHCNSGSRRDAEESLHHLLPNGISVFALDFAGSGNSEGEWVTLGAHEVDDLEVAVKHLRTEYPSATIGLWGRSMGAVTALLYTAKDPSIAGIVIDSAFARLTELMGELVEEQKLPIPRYLMRIALSMMRRSVRKRAKFNIDLVAPLEVAPQCHIPVLFGHATEDTFVKLSHSQRLRAAYGGLDKELETFAGDHNSIRPRKFYTSVLVFFHRALLCEDYEVAKASLDSRSVEERGSEVGAPSADRSQPSTALPDQLDAGPSREPAPPGQRQLSPPWDRNLTKTFTEKQLQAIRDNVQADLQIREQSKGVEKDDPKHALLANPCLKSDAVSMTRLGLADAERPANCSVERLGDAGVARDQSSDPWEAVEALGHQSSREYTDNETANSLFSDGSGSLSGTHSRNPSQPSFKRLGAINQASADDLTRRQISASDDLNVKHQGRHIDERDMVFGTLEQIRSMEEDEMVKRAIELSLLEHNKAGGATARDHVQSEDYRPHIPRELYGHDPEDAEEFMLAEALKRSLLEGPGGQPPALEDAGSTQSTPDSARRKRRSRALFWRSKSDASKTSSRNDCQK